MEYLVVLYPTSRRVSISDSFRGFTNEIIELEAGEYTVRIGPPANYSPKSKKIDLKGTSELHPRVLTFRPKNRPG